MSIGDFTNELLELVTETWTVNVFGERCATSLVFYESSRVYVFVALLSGVFSLNIVCGTDAAPQWNPSSATVLKPRMLFSIFESADQEVLFLPRSVQNWRNCPTARCGGNLTSVEHARWRGIFGCQHSLLEAILEQLWTRPDFHAMFLDFQRSLKRERWPAFTIPNLWVNAGA